MPAPVDHDERRRFVVAAASSYIAQHGLEATTIRTVARAAGYSASIITHYFDDKEHLLTAIFLDIVQRRQERLSQVAHDSDRPLRTALLMMLPIDATTRQDWMVYCAYLGSGVAKKELAATQAKSIEHTMDVVSGLVAREVGLGCLPATLPNSELAHLLVVFVIGLGVMATLDPAAYGVQRLENMLDSELRQRSYMVSPS